MAVKVTAATLTLYSLNISIKPKHGIPRLQTTLTIMTVFFCMFVTPGSSPADRWGGTSVGLFSSCAVTHAGCGLRNSLMTCNLISKLLLGANRLSRTDNYMLPTWSGSIHQHSDKQQYLSHGQYTVGFIRCCTCIHKPIKSPQPHYLY